MVSDREVIVPVDSLGFEIKILIHHSKKHQDIGLLDNTIAHYWLYTQQTLVGGRTSLKFFLIEWLKLEEAIKLYKKSCVAVLWNTQMGNHIMPVGQVLLVQI